MREMHLMQSYLIEKSLDGKNMGGLVEERIHRTSLCIPSSKTELIKSNVVRKEKHLTIE